MNRNFIKVINKVVPLHKDNKRVWIDSRKILDTKIGKDLSYYYIIDKERKTLTIKTGSKNNRKITVRKNGTPIIDINNSDITALYSKVEMISIQIEKDKITIKPMKDELARNKAKSKLGEKKITFVDMFAGAGTLSSAVAKGASAECKMAIELDNKYLEIHERNHPKTVSYNTSVVDMDTDLIPSSTILTAGIPCECYSPAGITKKKSMGCDIKEAGSTGSLGYFFLKALEAINPAVAIVENVPGFQNSAMRDMIVSVMQAKGYKVSEKILNASEYGSMTARKRYCMVATIADEAFVFEKVNIKNKRTVKDILEVSVEEREWHSKDTHKTLKYLLEKEVVDAKKGNGFKMARTRLKDTKVATITKGYYKLQSTGAILVHPENENLYSWFTPKELARINGLPEKGFYLPKAKTTAGQIIGQGIAFEPFEHIAKEVKKHIQRNNLTELIAA